MREIVGVGILLAVLALIAVVLLVADKKRHGLFPDDGIVWNTEIEKRMRRFDNGACQSRNQEEKARRCLNVQ